MFVTFASGALTLEGAMVRPPGCTQAAVVCHPHPQYGGDMDNPVVRALAGAFERHGHATLRFNFRGVGRSEGTYDGGRGEVDDVRAAVRCVRAHAHPQSATIAGYSFGAVMALQAAMHLPEATRLIAVAPPSAALDSLRALASCNKATLFIVGDRDPFCGIADLEQYVGHLPEPKMLEVIAGADHFFVGCEDAVAAAVTRFLSDTRIRC